MTLQNNSFIGLATATNVVTASKTFYTPLFGPKNNDTTFTKSDIDWANAFVELGKTPDFRLNTNSKVLNNASFTSNKFKGGFANETTLSITENTFEKNIVIYPNPAKNNVTIKFGNEINQNIEISILDLSGKTIEIFNTTDTEFKFNVTNLNSGVYFIKMNTNNETNTQRLIIE